LLGVRYFVCSKCMQHVAHLFYLHVTLTNLFSTPSPYFSQYQDTEVPQARFSYDLSPMSVTIIRKGKRFYEFITSMCALIGGTFTVVGLLSSFLNSIFKPKKM